MWNNATRSVGQFRWLTGLGPPVVFAHAGGPPLQRRHQKTYAAATPPSNTKVNDAHRLPVESLDRAKGESGILSARSHGTLHAKRQHALEGRCESTFPNIRRRDALSKLLWERSDIGIPIQAFTLRRCLCSRRSRPTSLTPPSNRAAMRQLCNCAVAIPIERLHANCESSSYLRRRISVGQPIAKRQSGSQA